MLVLRDYQAEALWQMVGEPTKAALVASEQGLGKTLLTVEFLKAMNFKRVLIVGIKDTATQWHDTSVGQKAQPVRVIDTTAEGKRNLAAYEAGDAGWFFIGHQLLVRRDHENYERRDGKKGRRHLKYWASLPPVDAVVADEVHIFAAYTSAGSTTLHSLPSEWKVALSGTWYGNKFENAWAPAYWLWPTHVHESFHFWKGKYCASEVAKNKWGKPVRTPRGTTIEVVTGERKPGQFVSELPCYIRHEDPDKMPEPKVIEVEIDPEQRRIYTDLEDQALAYLEDKPWVLELPISQRTALKTVTLAVPTFDEAGEIHFAANARSTKYDSLVAELGLHPGERVVIATDRKRYAKYVAARMRSEGYRVAEWHGDINTQGRAEVKRQWLAGEVDYIVCVMKSFSTGLDWAQVNCWRIGVLSSPEGDPTTKDQFLKRVFRNGPTKLDFEWFEVIAKDTYDTGIFSNIRLQSEAQRRSMSVEPVGSPDSANAEDG